VTPEQRQEILRKKYEENILKKDPKERKKDEKIIIRDYTGG